MGKGIVIQGADFSQNGIETGLDFTQMVADAGRWYPQRAIASLVAVDATANTKRCCIVRFDIYSIPDYSRFSKIKLIVKPGFDYVFAIGDSTTTVSPDHWRRVTGIETYDTMFAWVTNNQVAVGAMNRFINLNIRFDDNTTEFPTDADINDYISLQLIR